MPKNDEPNTGLDVKVIYPLPGTANQGAGGYGGGPQNGLNPIVFTPPTSSVVVLAVSAKDEKKDEKKEISSVFQRL